MSIAHFAHLKRSRRILAASATKHEAAPGNYLSDPLQPQPVNHHTGAAASWQPPPGNNPSPITGQPPHDKNGWRKIWRKLFHKPLADNQWQPPTEEGSEKDSKEKKEEPVAETWTVKEDEKEEEVKVEEVKEEEVKEEEEAEEAEEDEEDEEDEDEEDEDEPESEEYEEAQMEVDNEASPTVEFSADDKKVSDAITAKAELDQAEEVLAVAEATFDAILPSLQWTWEIPMKANTHAAMQAAQTAKADAQKAIDAAEKAVNKARRRWYKMIHRGVDNRSKEAKTTGLWEALFNWQAMVQGIFTPVA